MATSTRTLSTADQRREEILTAAAHVFAARGYHGTPTTEIAKAAGISQAYLFRLFPTKLELFVALVDRCYSLARAGFAAAAAQARANGEDVLEAMGLAYANLLTDRDQLLLQLQTHAAMDEPAIRDASRDGFRSLYEMAKREAGATDDEIRAWFAMGMLMNVLAGMRADEVDEPWARALVPEKSC
jgi:AcrR family transcriptional regulator